MAPLLDDEESALDPYAVLSITSTATEREIRKAYRQTSLKYHPDRNPTPEAAIKFRELSLSLEILIDPSKRSYVDGKLEAKRRNQEKWAASNKKRRDMLDALEAREEAAKKAKVDAVERRKAAAEEENIQEAGRRMLQEAQKRAAAAAAAPKSNGQFNGGFGGQVNGNGYSGTESAPDQSAGPSRSFQANKKSSNGNGNGPPPISQTDLTLILTIPSSSSLPSSSDDAQRVLEASYGSISHLIIKDPSTGSEDGETKKKGKKKPRRAVVEFAPGNWGGCWACWVDHCPEEVEDGKGTSKQRARKGKGLGEGVKAKWLAGSTPEWVGWADTQGGGYGNGRHEGVTGSASTNGNGNGPFKTSTLAPSFSFSSAPDLSSTPAADLLSAHAAKVNAENTAKRAQDDYENMTLFKMRQRERERMAEELRRQEEEEEA